MNVDHLVLLFNTEGQWIKGRDGDIIGKGVFETVLVDQGFSKSELRRLVAVSILKRVTTIHNGGWRTTYVLPTREAKIESNKKATPQFAQEDGRQSQTTEQGAS